MKDIELKKIVDEIGVAIESKNSQLVKKLCRDLLTSQPVNDKEREMNLQLKGLIASSTMDDLDHSSDADIRSAISQYMQENEDDDLIRTNDKSMTNHLINCWWAYAELYDRAAFKKADFWEAMGILDLLRAKRLKDNDPGKWEQIIFAAFKIASSFSAARDTKVEEIDLTVNLGEEYLDLTKNDKADASTAALKVKLARAYLVRSRLNNGTDRQKSTAHAEGVFSIITVAEVPVLWALAHEILGDIALVDGEMANNTAVYEKAIVHYQHYLTATKGLKMDQVFVQNKMALAKDKKFPVMTESYNIDIEIGNHSRLLAKLRYESEPEQWADAQLKMAELIIKEYEIKGSAALEDADNNCRNALRVFDKSSYPQKWARTQFVYATVFLYKSDQLIPSLSHSLKEMKETASGQTAQIVLGYAQHDDPEQALSRFGLALDIFDRKRQPMEWAYAYKGLGDAYSMRFKGETAHNKNEMIMAYENALTIFTPSANLRENTAIHKKYGEALVMYALRQGIDVEDGLKHLYLAAESWQAGDDETKSIHVYVIYKLIGDAYFYKSEWNKASGAYREGLARITRIISFGYSNEPKGELAEGIIEFVFHFVFTLYKERKYNEALLLMEHARNAKNLGKNSEVFEKDKIKLVLGMVPPNAIVVMPIITRQGGFVFILPHGKTQVTVNEIIPMDKLTNDVLEEILLGTKNSENGWLTTYAKWLEERDLKRWKYDISRHLELIGNALMEPIVRFVLDLDPEKKCEIVLVPSRGLSLMPLHAASGTVNSQGPLIEHFAVSYVNNLDELALAYKKSKIFTNDDVSLLSIINPTLDKNLAHTEQENKAIQCFFKKRQSYDLYGADAKKEKVLASISKYTYIHFACHGNYDWKEPEKSYLLMAQNQKIKVEEIQKAEKINCRLICLAACETSMANFRKAVDANSGFPNAFLRAGATGVISPLWEVADESTAILMRELYHHHVAGQMPPAQALRQAQLDLRNMFIEDKGLLSERMGFRGYGESSHAEIASMLLDESNEGKKFTHEFFWAPFVLWGC